ncbi:MAG: hypothetical protein IPQ14_01970 [Candidatus Microthrix sp.]|nr:hypothetical protein [Candidatus Microthrix sp.]
MVDGLADGTSAVIIKIHHSITDGVGGMKLQLALFNLSPDDPTGVTRTPRDPRTEPARARPTRSATRVAAAPACLPIGPSGAWVATGRPPTRLARSAPEELSGSVVRMIKPASPMSPLITERSLSVRFDTLQFPWPRPKGRQGVRRPSQRCLHRRLGARLRRYHEAHAQRRCAPHEHADQHP